MSLRLVLNGRFLGRPVTGVERLALELSRAMRALLAQVQAPDIAVVVPPAGDIAPERLDALGAPRPAPLMVGAGGGHRWEQTAAATVLPEAWLLSLCNIGPVTRRRQAVVICDAQIVLHPESYSRGFRWWYRLAQSLLGRRAGVVFTISDFSKAALERHRMVPRGKAQVLRLGVDHLAETIEDGTVLPRHGIAPRRYILAIGSLARHKNLRLLVDAFIDADLPDVTLVIAGGGNDRIFQAAGLPQRANIHYAGRVSDGELKALYAQALAFACPSLSEGFGFTPLEAMSTGCPVVATTGGAVPEVCGEAALYADPHDRAAWRDALRRVVDDPALRDDLARRSRDRAAQFTWRAAAHQALVAIARQEGDTALLEALARAER